MYTFNRCWKMSC